MEIILDAFSVFVCIYIVSSTFVLFWAISCAQKNNQRLINESLEIRFLLENLAKKKFESENPPAALSENIQPIASPIKPNNWVGMNEVFTRPSKVTLDERD
jgi:hypothetical protein